MTAELSPAALPPAARRLVEELQLQPHPEGGWYRETWRAAHMVATPGGERPAATSILFLLGGGAISRLHRLRQEELWLYQAGPGLDLHLFDPRGRAGSPQEVGAPPPRCLPLGPAGAPQALVPAGVWMGAEAPAGWALVACVCAPGFDFADLQFARGEDLEMWCPDHHILIDRLLG